MKKLLTLILILAAATLSAKPRVLVSTDIGGTDPDDNQSLAHLMMYTDRFRLEGLVSTPFSGTGSAEEIRRMIDLFELDFPKLQKHAPDLATPDYLRSITKQGARGAAPWVGYAEPTEGSQWIVECARRPSDEPLWVLVWGGLEDLAQALHDAPDIAPKIRVHWIGGPNKKWGANPYAYITANFPDLFFIENNASYYGFFSRTDAPDRIDPSDYYERHIAGAGHLGADFKNYYDGQVKMGDTPTLLYMMDGDPADPTGESWGGSFERFDHSPRVVFDRVTTLADTVAYCTVIEFRFRGPRTDMAAGTVCFWMDVPYGNRGEVQRWPGYYLGGGRYAIRYIPKVAETLTYKFVSEVPGFDPGEGALVADNLFPGKRHKSDYKLGANWYTDRSDPALYDGQIQGGKTTSKWRRAALEDWAKRWEWLRSREIVVSQDGADGAYTTIGEAIRSAPENSPTEIVIRIKNGIYREKVLIDRPNITLLGESRGGVQIIYPILSSEWNEMLNTLSPEERERQWGNGVVSLTPRADDCSLVNLTVYNNYGSTVNKTTAHQFSVFGRATRTIILSCDIFSDGNDDVALWNKDGVYYHADCYFRCTGVDYLCPRGSCFVENCKLVGNKSAQIWHDGSNDASYKFVVKNCTFDAIEPSWLGRYHHDSHFYLLSCTFSEMIIDRPIGYAYAPQREPENMKWGHRVYFHDCQGGKQFDWAKDNLDTAPGSPTVEQITPEWCFGGRWNPMPQVEKLRAMIVKR